MSNTETDSTPAAGAATWTERTAPVQVTPLQTSPESNLPESDLPESDLPAGFTGATTTILDELQRTLHALDPAQAASAAQALRHARRIFVTGAGRSGLALKMAAMRLMHLGLTVHVAGEVTAPAIAAGDLLLVASGSGTTAGVVHATEVARKVGAAVLAITAAPASTLAKGATVLITVPAATKQGNDGTLSRQYAGALFEQAVLLLMDALFQTLWHQSGQRAEELWPRHANLE